MSDPIVIVGAARTPMGGFQGELSGAKAPLRLVGVFVHPAQSEKLKRGPTPETAQGQGTPVRGDTIQDSGLPDG